MKALSEEIYGKSTICDFSYGRATAYSALNTLSRAKNTHGCDSILLDNHKDVLKAQRFWVSDFRSSDREFDSWPGHYQVT